MAANSKRPHRRTRLPKDEEAVPCYGVTTLRQVKKILAELDDDCQIYTTYNGDAVVHKSGNEVARLSFRGF